MPENPQQHIKRLRREKFGWAEDGSKLANPLEQDLRQALKHLAEELYAKKHHFILELIQNAEDNTYREGDSPMLSLQLLADDPTCTPGANSCLLLLNNELGFQPAQVQSLCSVGQSTKTKREGYIGEKGIGFKSVFQVTNRPHVFSNGYHFHFRRAEGEDDLGYIVPHWIESAPGVVNESNARTAILLPLILGERESIASQLLAIAPETILFLTKLSALHIDTGTAKRTVIRDVRDGFVTLHSGNSEINYFVVRAACRRPEALHEEKRAGIDQRELTVALPLRVSDGFTGRIFAFLPTECDSGLPFLVNADFLLTASREAILVDHPWNQWLRNCMAPVFTATFKMLLQHEPQRHEAYRFLPIQDDLRQQMADFFSPAVDSIHKTLRDEECVWTQSGSFVRPNKAWFAGKAERALLKTDVAPPGLAPFSFVVPELERWRERLRPLGVHDFTTKHFLEVINDLEWLQRRDETWWEDAFQLLAERKVTATDVAQIPLLRCADGVCRTVNANEVFLSGDAPVQLPSEGPEVHVVAASLQQRLQQKPVVWSWLTQTLRLTPLSVRAYVVSKLLPWMRAQTGDGSGARLVAAARFIFTNSAVLDEATRTILKGQMSWVLANGRVVTPESGASKEFVSPEALEEAEGWNCLFVGSGDREHFLVLTDNYVAGVQGAEKESWQKFFSECGVTSIPDPAKRELSSGQALYGEALARCASEVRGAPQLRDWGCPRWLHDLASEEAIQNGGQKLAALEQWVQAFRSDHFTKFLRLSKKDQSRHDWEALRSWSELGSVLRTKPWLKTSRGYRSPSDAFMDTLEFREFLEDSVPYVQSKLPVELLEKLGVRVRLTGDVLIDLLRQMRASGSVNFDRVTRIYRRLHDSQFDTNLFRTEALVYLAEPPPQCWRAAGELVWKDTGPVFDQNFGYLELTYGEQDDVHGFFTQKLQVPEEPDLRQFAEVWVKLSEEDVPPRDSVEKRLKRVLERLISAQEELASQPWWPQVRQRLRVWTTESGFMDAHSVYAPDDGFAAEVFAKRVPLAWNPTQAHRFAPFLKSLGCRSLASALRATLVEQPSESAPPASAVMTPAAKELIVLMVCNAPNWRESQPVLEAILATEEVLVPEVVVDYSLNDNPGINPVRQTCDAFWQHELSRLSLKTGAEADAGRSAAAESIAAVLAGVMQRRELVDTIYRLLTATTEAARRLQRERNWSLSAQQDEWLRSVNWSRVIIELRAEDAEPTRPARQFPQQGATQPSATSATGTPPAPQFTMPTWMKRMLPPTTATGTPPAPPAEAPLPQSDGKAQQPPSGSGQASPSQLQASPPTPESPSGEAASEQPGQTERGAPLQPEPASAAQTTQREHETPDRDAREIDAEAPRIRLKAPGAEKPELALAQARPRTRRRERAATERVEREPQTGEEERRPGLESLSQAEKAELERRGRDYATRELMEMGYSVTPMGEKSPGYDLLARRADGVLKVEVKAHLRGVSKVFVPKREWKEYLESQHEARGRWELWNVEFLAEDAGRRVRITRYSEIPPDAIEESGFWVDLRLCSSSHS